MEECCVKLTLPEIGSVEKQTQTQWVYENNEMVYRSVSYVPALYNIFDDILVTTASTSILSSLKVTIDVDQNLISVSSNNGGGFQLLSYEQVFGNNVENTSHLGIKCSSEGSEFWTTVSFKPYLAKFNMTELEVDVVALMKKRVVDMAGILGKSVKVELNGKCVPVNSFTDYASLYLQAASKSRSVDAAYLPRIVAAGTFGDRWEICVSLSDGQFQQVSFVNGVATVKGGTHVDYVTNQISRHLMAVAKKKNNNAIITADTVKNCLWVFVNSLIDNPSFDSPTKETLITCQNRFGSTCELSPVFLKEVEKSGVVDTLLGLEQLKKSNDLKKTDVDKKRRRVTGIANLVEAKKAGGKNSDKCTLILTVGDEAQYIAAVLGISTDYYGVYLLRKKLLNVSAHKSDNLFKRKLEFRHIRKILGLFDRQVCNSVKSLRYGHLMIMTDQVQDDGSHLKGLLINFIHSHWPSLLRIRSFLVDPMTPIVKATHRNGEEVMSFYSMPEYESWIKSLGGNTDTWAIRKYRLGFASWTKDEVRKYFSDLDQHKKEFLWENEKDDAAIELAFSKDIEKRINWLRKFKPGTYLPWKDISKINYSDFVNKELILFAMAELKREIPSMVDGLNPCQRKILFCCLKGNLVEPLSVSELCGHAYVHLAYSDGMASLENSIISLAQIFVGSNNLSLLEQCSGRFGCRHHGGEVRGDICGMYVKLSPITRYLFHKDDDSLLKHNQSESGQSIEPTWYMPVIPTVLVNGSEVTSAESASYIPPKYKPSDIVANMRRLLKGERMKPMVPWYNRFRGTIRKSATQKEGGGVSYTSAGLIEDINETTFRVTELPVGQWTEEYLRKLRRHKKAVEEQPFIKRVSDMSDDSDVDLKIVLSSEMGKVDEESKLEKFNLTTTIRTDSMYLFDSKGEIKKYDSPEQIIEEFYNLRLPVYEKRKKVLVDKLVEELRLLLDRETKLTADAKRDDAREIADVVEEIAEVIGSRNKKIADVIGLMKTSATSLWLQDLDNLDEQLPLYVEQNLDDLAKQLALLF